MKISNAVGLRRPEPGSRLLVATIAVLAGGTLAATSRAQTATVQEIPFDEARIFFELNDTDGDLGIHALIDGDPWRLLNIWNPSEVKLLNILVTGKLRRQGLTELFFESAEPPFDELPPEQFFGRFPEGEYEIEGLTLEGEELESTDELSHVMPAPPVARVSGKAAAENCDVTPLPVVSEPAVLRWNEVTHSHPQIGTPGVEIEVEQYQVVVEGEEFTLDVQLSPDVRVFRVPPALTESGDRIKFEILVREESGNQTAIESCYIVK